MHTTLLPHLVTAKRIKKAHAVKKTVPRGGEALLEQHKLQKENKDAMQVDEDDTTTYPCLVRAKFKDTTLSTTVAPEDFLQFQESYRTVVIAYMNSLKKKDRKKSKKRTKTDN